MIKTIIIDDEIRSRDALLKLLNLYCPEVTVIDQADRVISGVASVRKHKPDLVLLDIKMPDGTGFDLIRQLEHIDFKIIFVTAFEEYAIKAFKFSALDYLLKPINPEELAFAIGKVSQSLNYEGVNSKINDFLAYMEQFKKHGESKKIILKTAENMFVVDFEDIISVESDQNYSRFHLVEGESILVAKTMKEYTDILQSNYFYKVHKSFIINLHHLKRYDRNENICIMSDGSKIPVSFRKKDELFSLFRSLS